MTRETCREIIAEAKQLICVTEKLLSNNPKSIDTNYVRNMKAKSKAIYNLASQGNQLDEQQKKDITILYKKLRTMLKEIDSKNN